MNDDDFLDKLLNSSGDDLDRLINNDLSKMKRKRSNHEIEVDMSDIEKILNSNLLENAINSKDNSITVTSNKKDTSECSEEYFKHIYEQLTYDDYSINRTSAINSQNEKHLKITSIVIRIILVSIGIIIGVIGAIWVSQIILKLFPI